MNDDLIIFEGSEIRLRDGVDKWKCFSELLLQDKTKRKGHFNLQLKYLYYVYTKASPLSDRYTPKERDRIFFEQIEPTAKPSKVRTFELKECIPVIRRHTLLRSEAQLERVLEDFDALLDHLNSVPWEVEVVEEIKEGKSIRTKTYKQSNQEAKMKAIKSSSDLMTLQKSVEKIMKEERKAIVAGGQKTRMFEDPESMEFV